MSKKLAVFDFDHTVIDDNSDTAITKLVDRKKITPEVRVLHKSDGWTAFMQGVFKILHQNNIGEENMKELIEHLPAVKDMPELIREINEKFNFDIIIVSDSNSYFIDLWLEAHGLKGNILRVFTNPAYFDNGLLKIQMYHLQDYCKLSTKNLCKGQIMEDFIREQKQNNVVYDTVVYCGDGFNDFCPILRLSSKDIACVRDQYKCAEMVKKAKEEPYIDAQGIPRSVEANVCVWNNGTDILNYIKRNVL